MSGKRKTKVGLALAGGGPEGAIYEIGALRALEDAIDGLDFNEMEVYVGVSAGAFLGAHLANGIDTKQLCRGLISTDAGEHPFVPELFFTPAVGEFWRSSRNVPRFALDAIKDYIGNMQDRTILKSLTKLSGALPTGLFDNLPVRKYVDHMLGMKGRSNDFRALKRKLFIVAADLDSGEPVIFGSEDWDHIPISLAVQASTALPGLYPPVSIEGRHYVDGVLLKTLHASTVLDSGVDLTFCINPIVPVDTRTAVQTGYMRRGKLIDRGMPSVMAQTFRTLIHSRLVTGIASYVNRYDADVLLFEPSKEDYRMFFTNIFSFASRKAVCEHAYRSVRRDLTRRRNELEPILERHGLKFRDEVLYDRNRDVWEDVGLTGMPKLGVTRNLERALAKLENIVRTETPS